jgi:hypothetical protein
MLTDATVTPEDGIMKFKRLSSGKIFVQFKYNPSEHLLSTPDEVAAAGIDGSSDDFALFMDAAISIIDTEVRTVIIDPEMANISLTTKKKLRKRKVKQIEFGDIKQIQHVENKKRNALFLDTGENEKDLIALHKSPRKIKKILGQIEDTIGSRF